MTAVYIIFWVSSVMGYNWTLWPLGDVTAFLKVQSLNTCFGYAFMITYWEIALGWMPQNSFGWEVKIGSGLQVMLGTIREQAIITWARVNPDLCCHMASLGRNVLMRMKGARHLAAVADNTLLAPGPLTVVWPNSKLHQNLKCSVLKGPMLITTKFCTHHDSVTVVMCAKFRCDQLSTF